MTKTLEATFDGAVLRPDEPVELQPNTRVQIVVTVTPTQEQTPESFLQVARLLHLKGPADWSSRLDDYLEIGNAYQRSVIVKRPVKP